MPAGASSVAWVLVACGCSQGHATSTWHGEPAAFTAGFPAPPRVHDKCSSLEPRKGGPLRGEKTIRFKGWTRMFWADRRTRAKALRLGFLREARGQYGQAVMGTWQSRTVTLERAVVRGLGLLNCDWIWILCLANRPWCDGKWVGAAGWSC